MKRRKKSWVSLVLALAPMLVLAHAPLRQGRAEDDAPEVAKSPIDVTSHRMVVRFDPPRHRLVAETIITVEAAQNGRLVLDLAPSLLATELAVDGHALLPKRSADGCLEVLVPAGRHEVFVAWRGRVHDRVEAADDLAWVAGDSTSGLVGDEGVFLTAGSAWMPMPRDDAMALYHVTTYTPAGLFVVTQGNVPQRSRMSVRGFDESGNVVVPRDGEGAAAADAQSSFEVAASEAVVATDGLSLSAGRWVSKQRQVDGVLLGTWFLPSHAPLADLWLNAAQETVVRYAALLGTYPHPKFDIVENFFQSGYGMPSYTLLGDKVIAYVTAKAQRSGGKIPPGYLDHEYVHGWYGNGLHVDYAAGNWCEALTTYLSNYLAVELEHGGPESPEAIEHRRATMEKFAIRVRGQADYPLRAFRTKTEDFDNDVGYGKGSLLFHMVRRSTPGGEPAFWETLRQFTTAHLGRIVRWRDFRDAWREAATKHVKSDVGGAQVQGAFDLLSPWLDRPGLPSYALQFAGSAPVDPAAPNGAHEATIVASETTEGARFGGIVPIRLEGVHEGTSWTRDVDATFQDAQTTIRVVVPSALERATLDPAFHVARRIPDAALPPCLEGTLRAEGPGVILVDGDEAAFGGLARKLERSTGWPVMSASGFDLEGHMGPAVVLRLEAPGREAIAVQGQRAENEGESFLATTTSGGRPRTWFVAANAAAASRAGYAPFYGWDTWVRFHNGVPGQREVVRAAIPESAIDLRSSATVAAARVRDWVEDLSNVARAPTHARLRGALVGRMEGALQRAGFVPLGGGGAGPSLESFAFSIPKAGEAAAFRYSGVHRQGAVVGPGIRAAAFSAQRAGDRWMDVGSGSGQAAFVAWSDPDARALYEDAKRRAAAAPGAIVYVVDSSAWDGLAVLMDRIGDLTPAGEAERARLDRKGKLPYQGPVEAWLAARLARAGLPNLEALPVPVLLLRVDAVPVAPDVRGEPWAWMQEVGFDFYAPLERVSGRNVLYWLPPARQARPGERTPVVVLSAHYDSLPGLDPGGKPLHPGADDNASGVACLLEIARGIATEDTGEPFGRSAGVVLALLDAEEWGLQGSEAFAPALGGAFDVLAVVNVDSIGRASSQPTHVIGRSKHPELAASLMSALEAAGLGIGRDIDRFAFESGSDHWPFHRAGIPAVTIWAGDYEVMNTPADVAKLVEAPGVVVVAEGLRGWLQGFLRARATAARETSETPVEDAALLPACSGASIVAWWTEGRVRLVAEGMAPTPGHDVRFIPLTAVQAWPPRYVLACIPPTGIVAQVLTPFHAETSFAAPEPPPSVFVRDAGGLREIPVDRR